MSAQLSQGERDMLQKYVESSERTDNRKVTNWRLVTGAPGSGKTTLIRSLQQLNFDTVEDPGRAVLVNYACQRNNKTDPRADYLLFQQIVRKRAVKTFLVQDPLEKIYFDYGVAECLAFLKASNIPWREEFVEAAVSIKFDKVFLCSLVPVLSEDTLRTETKERREELQCLIGEIYSSLGHTVKLIPCLTLDERLKLVLDQAVDG